MVAGLGCPTGYWGRKMWARSRVGCRHRPHQCHSQAQWPHCDGLDADNCTVTSSPSTVHQLPSPAVGMHWGGLFCSLCSPYPQPAHKLCVPVPHCEAVRKMLTAVFHSLLLCIHTGPGFICFLSNIFLYNSEIFILSNKRQ